MGARGPVPARTSALSRERDADRGDRTPVTKGEMQPVQMWPADPEWDEITTRLYESYATSGQYYWAQQTDVARLYWLCDEINEYRRKGIVMEKDPETKRLVPKRDENGDYVTYPNRKVSGQMFAALDSALGEMLFSEGSRRRARIELEPPKEDEDDAEVTYLSQVENDLSTF